MTAWIGRKASERESRRAAIRAQSEGARRGSSDGRALPGVCRGGERPLIAYAAGRDSASAGADCARGRDRSRGASVGGARSGDLLPALSPAALVPRRLANTEQIG